MAESTEDTRPSYPYMSANQWWGLRSRFKKSVPSSGLVTIEWIMAALDTTQKGAGNVLPQLRLLGLTDASNKVTDVVYDFKDDDTYKKATAQVLKSAYPAGLLEAHDDPGADATKVAGWFGRYAKTGERASINQAKLYLLILSGALPSADEATLKPKATPKPSVGKPPMTTKAVVAPAQNPGAAAVAPAFVPESPASNIGPTLHVDLQIHIAADAGDAQIDAIFKSMAKHLYGK